MRRTNRTLGAMLHDALMGQPGRETTPDDRREAQRQSDPATELVIVWHHDMETAIRYPLVDRTDEGVRILTATPLVKGMTGTAMHLLPKGATINRPCTVRWSRPREESRGFEAGLRFL